MKYTFFGILLFSFLFTAPSHAQYRSSVQDRASQDILGSIDDVAEWYDAPITLIFLANNTYKADNPSTKIFSLPPFPFERAPAAWIAEDGGTSLGSMDARILPATVLGVRMLYAFGHTLFSEESMRDEYAHGFVLMKVLMYNHIATELIKNTVRRERPDGSDTKSFFSGHTSSAFAMNSYLYREVDAAIDEWAAVTGKPVLRDGLKGLSFVALYGWAGYVGYSRVADSKHYLSDVLVGAVVGSLMGNLLYDRYFDVQDTYIPRFGFTYLDSQPALSVSMKF